MGAELKNGVAEPAELVPGATAAGEFSSDFMANVLKRKGIPVPASLEAKTPEEIEAAETAKAEAAAAKENEGKTPEEIEAAETAKAEAAAATTAGDESAKETEEAVKVKLKDLPEAQRKIVQSIIDARIGAISGKSKENVERLESRVVELTAELDTTRKGTATPVVIGDIHPTMLMESAEQIDAYSDRLLAFEDKLDLLKDTGIEADEEKGTAGFTPEQVRARLREVQKERERVLPQARALLQKRAETAAALKAAYPALYNPTTEEFRLADALRKQLPELRRIPDADVFIAKLVLGSKVYTDLTKNPKSKTTTVVKPAVVKKTETQPAPRKAPRAPGDGAAALGSVLDDASRRVPDSSGAVNTFTKTRSREDLKKAVGALVFR